MLRYAVFIDGGHVSKGLQTYGDPRIDFLKLSEEVAHGQDRLRTYYYYCPPYISKSPTDEERKRQSAFDSFKRALERLPRFQVRLGRLARSETAPGGFVQKMVDILLTIDLITLALEHQIQRAVLVAGDSDYVPAIQVARNAGTVVELYYLTRPHDALLEACDDRIRISSAFIDRIRMGKSPGA